MIYMTFGPCCWGLGRGVEESLRLALTDLDMRLVEGDRIVFNIYECGDDTAWIDEEGVIQSPREADKIKATERIETRVLPKERILEYRSSCYALEIGSGVKREYY